MSIWRKLALAILSPLFVSLLFATAFDIGFVRTATHPATVKRLVAESGIYNSLTPSLLQQAKSISTYYGDISTSDPIIQKAANSTLSPEFIQQNTEMVVDNIYDWLNGKIAEPNFKIELAGSKALFAKRIADDVKHKLDTLPKCSLAQSQQIAQSGQFDVYNATCQPANISPDTIALILEAQISSNKDLLSNTTITSSDIKNGDSNKSIFNDQLKQAPTQYQRLKKTPAILSVLTILAGIGIVFLSSTWQKGLRHIGINLLVIGLVMLLFSWGLNWAVSKKIAPKIKVDNVVLQQDIRNLVTDVTQQIDKNYWVFGGLYTGLGVSGIVVAEVFRRRVAAPEHAKSGTPGEEAPLKHSHSD